MTTYTITFLLGTWVCWGDDNAEGAANACGSTPAAALAAYLEARAQ